MKVEEEGDLYLSLHCHHQNDSCFEMGSDESHFNVSLIVRDKVTRQCPQTTILEEKGRVLCTFFSSSPVVDYSISDARPTAECGQFCAEAPQSDGCREGFARRHELCPKD